MLFTRKKTITVSPMARKTLIVKIKVSSQTGIEARYELL